jgi:RNA polymerase sigma-B factor
MSMSLVARYGSMVRSCAYHYHLPAQYTEELIQVGYVGLLKAINNFDPALSERLSGYAQACISGEIKRFFRDKRWQLRVRRVDKEVLLQARTVRAELVQQFGRVPADAEVASRLGVSVAALEAADLAADAFAPASLDAQLTSSDGLTLGDILGCSQMHVSRLQARALSHLRRRLLAD